MPCSKITKPNRLRTCNFCRKNHLKCDSKQPCVNCSLRKIECVFSTRKPRSTKRELQLEKELERLKAEYASLINKKTTQMTVREEFNTLTVMSHLYNALQYQAFLFYGFPEKVFHF